MLLTQGEIHMSDDAIHDILEQTESDPAFQALFDLFDYSKYSLLFIIFACCVQSISQSHVLLVSYESTNTSWFIRAGT